MIGEPSAVHSIAVADLMEMADAAERALVPEMPITPATVYYLRELLVFMASRLSLFENYPIVQQILTDKPHELEQALRQAGVGKE